MAERTAAATDARRRIDLDEMRHLLDRGVLVDAIAEHFGVGPQSIRNTMTRHGIRQYPSVTDEDIVQMILSLQPTTGPMDGYRVVAARLRYGLTLSADDVASFADNTPRPILSGGRNQFFPVNERRVRVALADPRINVHERLEKRRSWLLKR